MFVTTNLGRWTGPSAEWTSLRRSSSEAPSQLLLNFPYRPTTARSCSCLPCCVLVPKVAKLILISLEKNIYDVLFWRPQTNASSWFLKSLYLSSSTGRLSSHFFNLCSAWFRPNLDVTVITVENDGGHEGESGEVEGHPDVYVMCWCRVFSGRPE